MKKSTILLYLLFVCAPVFAQTGTLKITVTNIDASKSGLINIAIYGKEGFLETDEAIMSKSVKVTGSTVSTEITNVPAGTWAIAVFHDENSDEKLNTNFIGIPKEAVGFSNNESGKFGPPKFEKVSVVVEEGQLLELTINVKKII